MSDDAFLEILASCTEACANMDLSDSGWYPPDDNFDVVVESVASGTKENKGGVICGWLKPIFGILDGKFKGQTFSDYFWIEPHLSEPSVSIKNLCRFATCLQGSETRNPIEAAEIAKAAGGEFLNVDVYRTTSKKTGKTYPNIRFCQKLEATDATEEN